MLPDRRGRNRRPAFRPVQDRRVRNSIPSAATPVASFSVSPSNASMLSRQARIGRRALRAGLSCFAPSRALRVSALRASIPDAKPVLALSPRNDRAAAIGSRVCALRSQGLQEHVVKLSPGRSIATEGDY